MPREFEDYASHYTTAEMPVLAALGRETQLKVTQAVMLSGHLQGALLQLVSKLMAPSRILEIGTYTGYSAICLAQGLRPGGVLHTIDIDDERTDMAAKYIAEAGLGDTIVQHIGDARDIIPNLDEVFDLVFIDADKTSYEYYLDAVIGKVRSGGCILADNVLYEGDVLLPPERRGKNVRAIVAFNEKVRNDPRIEHVLLPIRDGIMAILKK